jgi:hypothetical protein
LHKQIKRVRLIQLNCSGLAFGKETGYSRRNASLYSFSRFSLVKLANGKNLAVNLLSLTQLKDACTTRTIFCSVGQCGREHLENAFGRFQAGTV